jgi:hypothetical protein
VDGSAFAEDSIALPNIEKARLDPIRFLDRAVSLPRMAGDGYGGVGFDVDISGRDE